MIKAKAESKLAHDIIKGIEKKYGFKVQLQVVQAVIHLLIISMIERTKLFGYCGIKNFFSMSLKEKKARVAVNPKTGEKFTLPDRKQFNVRLALKLRKLYL